MGQIAVSIGKGSCNHWMWSASCVSTYLVSPSIYLFHCFPPWPTLCPTIGLQKLSSLPTFLFFSLFLTPKITLSHNLQLWIETHLWKSVSWPNRGVLKILRSPLAHLRACVLLTGTPLPQKLTIKNGYQGTAENHSPLCTQLDQVKTNNCEPLIGWN